MKIEGYNLVPTCGACPEQYDVFLGGKQVGYLRLRHGYFVAYYPDYPGEAVYGTSTSGDGMFEDFEREFHLTNAIRQIDKKVKSHETTSIEKEELGGSDADS